MFISKSDVVRKLVEDGDYKKALSIVKGFRLGAEKEDLSKIALAYECLIHKKFYEQLGTDIERAVADGIQILKKLYGREKDG